MRKEAICEVFAQGGLDKYSTPFSSHGYVVEAKTNRKGNRPRISKRQATMFQLARKLGFEVILITVALRDNYKAEITLLYEEGFLDMESGIYHARMSLKNLEK